nr:integrase, catalytic region, zinc finger, CCHC-type, peptidase aspartic, catalytic [Tanacetum cinerariifolium]
TKKPSLVPISARKRKDKANKSVVTPHQKTVASDTTIQQSKSYIRELYENTNKIVQLIPFIIDSRCRKHLTGNLKLLCNFVDKISRVYYVKGLNHNLFLVGQFYDADLEVAFRKSTYYVRDLQGNDLLTGNRGSDL